MEVYSRFLVVKEGKIMMVKRVFNLGFICVFLDFFENVKR